jgi:hypothetical protein
MRLTQLEPHILPIAPYLNYQLGSLTIRTRNRDPPVSGPQTAIQAGSLGNTRIRISGRVGEHVVVAILDTSKR